MLANFDVDNEHRHRDISLGVFPHKSFKFGITAWGHSRHFDASDLPPEADIVTGQRPSW
jgi:hypothetical protein